MPRTQRNQLIFISEFTTNIQYVKIEQNIVADTMSRIEAVSATGLPISCCISRDTDEFKHFIDNNSARHLEIVSVPGSPVSIDCDTTMRRPCPFLPQQFRRFAFDQVI